MAYPLVCLATDRTFNFSKLIFNSMKGNVKSPYKFVMYPRFVQAVLNEFPLQPHKRVYKTPCLKPKVFQNMNKASDGWNGEFKPLFPEMLAKIIQLQGEVQQSQLYPNTHPLLLFHLSITPHKLLTHMIGGKNSHLLPLQHCMFLNLLV